MEIGVQLGGWQKLSLSDYPDRPCSVLFCRGCPFRCLFCYNRDLVLPDRFDKLPEPPGWEAIFDFIRRRKAAIGAVCVSGGEPLASEGCIRLLRALRSLGAAVKLDTNGYYPERLKTVLTEKLVDVVAMDIKNRPSRYAETCGLDRMDLDRIAASIDLLRKSGIKIEFRTTVVRELHDESDLRALSEWGIADERVVFSSFEANPNVIRPGLSAYSAAELRSMIGRLRRNGLPKAALRGEDEINLQEEQNEIHD